MSKVKYINKNLYRAFAIHKTQSKALRDAKLIRKDYGMNAQVHKENNTFVVYAGLKKRRK